LLVDSLVRSYDRTMITVEARPQPVTIDPRRAALLVVDMQNDFGAPGGMFQRAGIDISGIAAAAAATRDLFCALRGMRASRSST